MVGTSGKERDRFDDGVGLDGATMPFVQKIRGKNNLFEQLEKVPFCIR